MAALAVAAATAAFVGLMIITLAGGFLQASAACDGGGGAVGGGVVVGATVYAGGGPGAYGAGLAGHLAFAELGLWSHTDTDRAHADRIGTAVGLGGPLAAFTRLEIRAPNGRVVVAEKRDVGMGGPPIDGHARAIDLWTTTRQALGLGPDWSGLVTVEMDPGGIVGTETGDSQGAGQQGVNACAAAAIELSPADQRIVALAQSQLGTGEHPPGSNCTVYGPCEEWCALFTTWVWRRAGVAIGSLGFSGAIYAWAAQRGRTHGPSATPRPGWAALFGSGPTDPGTSQHVAIVDSVLANGEVTFINGNFAGAVTRTGPCLPARAQLTGAGGCQEPAPIYGYAAPE